VWGRLGIHSVGHGMTVDIQHLDGSRLEDSIWKIRSHTQVLTFLRPIFLYLHNLIRVPESLAACIHGLGLDDVEMFGGRADRTSKQAGFWKKRRNPDVSQADE
jgi:hypothetical protein